MGKRPIKILLTTNYVGYKVADKKRWQKTALNVMAKNSPSNVMLAFFNYEDETTNIINNNDTSGAFRVFKMLKRNSRKIINNDRDMPYIKEIFNNCSKLPCDIFGYVNSDILINKDFFKVFKNNIDTYIFSRTDINEVSEQDFLKGKIEVSENSYSKGLHDGVDGVFFRKKWWLENRDKFHDDLVLGEPYWDWYYRKAIKNNSKRNIEKHNLYHVHHVTKWTFDSNGAKNNTRIWEEYDYR